MTELADQGYLVEATITHGPQESEVRRFLVDASSEASAIVAMRRFIDIEPEDVLDARPLSVSEIRKVKLQPGELRALGRE